MRKRLKIGFLITYFYPFIGGAENNCFHLAKELAKKHEVHVFTSDRRDGRVLEKKEEVVDGIKVHRCRTWLRYRMYLAFYPSLLLKLLRADLDVLHVHGFGFPWHDFCILAKKLFSPKTKLINTPHGPFMALPKYSFPAILFKVTYTQVEKPINSVYDVVIQVNPNQYKWITRCGVKRKKIKYLPNGIPEEVFRDLSDQNDLTDLDDQIDHFDHFDQLDQLDHSIMKLKGGIYDLQGKSIISFLGSIKRYKGIHQVIRVLPAVVKKFPNVLFLIMGRDGGYKKELEKLIAEKDLSGNVKTVESPSDEEKFRVLEASEIFIFPSQWEAFGISMLEAMAKGNAVISTKTEGGRFLIKEGVGGGLFEYGDLETLEKYLIKLLGNEGLRKRMMKENVEKAKGFKWSKIAKKYKKLL